MNLQQTDKGQKKPGHKLKMAARIKLLKIIQVLYQQTRSQRTGRVFWKNNVTHSTPRRDWRSAHAWHGNSAGVVGFSHSAACPQPRDIAKPDGPPSAKPSKEDNPHAIELFQRERTSAVAPSPFMKPETPYSFEYKTQEDGTTRQNHGPVHLRTWMKICQKKNRSTQAGGKQQTGNALRWAWKDESASKSLSLCLHHRNTFREGGE